MFDDKEEGAPKDPQFRLSGSIYIYRSFFACGLTRVKGERTRPLYNETLLRSVGWISRIASQSAGPSPFKVRLSPPHHIPSATPRRSAAGIALHAGAVAHQCVVAAIAAGLAFVALHLGAGDGGDGRG